MVRKNNTRMSVLGGQGPRMSVLGGQGVRMSVLGGGGTLAVPKAAGRRPSRSESPAADEGPGALPQLGQAAGVTQTWKSVRQSLAVVSEAKPRASVARTRASVAVTAGSGPRMSTLAKPRVSLLPPRTTPGASGPVSRVCVWGGGGRERVGHGRCAF